MNIKSKLFLLCSYLFTHMNNFFESKLQKKEAHLVVSSQFRLANLTNYVQETSISLARNEKWGIVFHGKIYDQKCLFFLLQSIKETRYYLPDIPIYVATYEDEFFDKLKQESIRWKFELLKTEDAGELPTPYPKSLCQQINSVSTGLLKAKDEGIKKVVKIRVDQRVNLEKLIPIISSNNKLYPGKCGASNGRLWVTSYNTYLLRPLGASDMVTIGEIEDVIKYWSPINVSDWIELTSQFKSELQPEEKNLLNVPETWLAFRFIKNQRVEVPGIKNLNSLFWRDFAGVINASSIQQNWYKTYPWLGTNFHTMNWFGSIYGPDFAEISFEDWLVLYSN